MYRTISAQVDEGVDSLIRVANTLRRKEFLIRGVSMRETSDEHSDLIVTIEEKSNLGIEQAILQMKKIINVYEIKELEGEF